MARFDKKRLATIAVTFSVALGTGFLVQYGDAVASRWGAEAPVSGPNARFISENNEATPVTANAVVSNDLPTPQPVAAQSATNTLNAMPTDETAPVLANATLEAVNNSVDELDPMESSIGMTNADFGLETGSIDVQSPAFDDIAEELVPSFATTPTTPDEPGFVGEAQMTIDCSISMTAIEMKLAIVQIQLSAPCHGDRVLAIHHDNLMFNAMTDGDGNLIVDVPALSEDAFFIAAFDGGEGAIAQTTVPDFADYDRAVLQWQGDTGVELHALEFGSAYGDYGHRWSGSLGEQAGAYSGLNGLITRLGDNAIPMPMMAEVYTFPSGKSSQDGSVALTVEAAVETTNCNQPISAQTIQIRPMEKPVVSTISMTLPSCDAVGEYVLLQNIFEDLKLASK